MTMRPINRMIINFCSDDLKASKAFFLELFSFELAYDSDWYVQLHAREASLELGIIARNSEIVPEGARGRVGGSYLTLVVDDVDAVYAEAQQRGFDILAPPVDTFYGQRRLLLKEPNGACVDVSSPISDVSPSA